MAAKYRAADWKMHGFSRKNPDDLLMDVTALRQALCIMRLMKGEMTCTRSVFCDSQTALAQLRSLFTIVDGLPHSISYGTETAVEV